MLYIDGCIYSIWILVDDLGSVIITVRRTIHLFLVRRHSVIAFENWDSCMNILRGYLLFIFHPLAITVRV